MKKIIKIFIHLLLLLTLITNVKGTKGTKSFIKVDKCGCTAQIPTPQYSWSKAEGKGYYEFLKQQIQYFHEQWIDQLINSMNTDKIYHVLVKELSSKQVYTKTENQSITIDIKNHFLYQ